MNEATMKTVALPSRESLGDEERLRLESYASFM